MNIFLYIEFFLFIILQVPENLTYRQVNADCNIEEDEESSYSSFYSSFLKTDPGSGSNEDNNNFKQSKEDRQVYISLNNK